MEQKKTKRANVERQAGFTGNFFLVGLVVSIALVIVAFQWRSYDQTQQQMTSDIKVPEEEQIAEVTKQKKKKPKPPAPPEIEVVEDDVDVEDDQPEVQEADMMEDMSVDLPSGGGEETESEDEIFVAVEDQPKFPGGKSELFRYLRNTINYPRSAKEAGIEGTVIVNFVVNKDGSITDVQVQRGVTEKLNQEAKRVVRDMPDWNPGKQRGKPVRVRYRVPIRFSLN
jgi:protein TonB